MSDVRTHRLSAEDIDSNFSDLHPPFDDHEALVVRTADVDTLAVALDRITADAALRDRLGTAARARFEERFTAAAMVERYEALYRRLLGHGTGTGTGAAAER